MSMNTVPATIAATTASSSVAASIRSRSGRAGRERANHQILDDAFGKAADLGGNAVPERAIQCRGLEAERRQVERAASARRRARLEHPDQMAAHALASMALVDPELLQLRALAPCTTDCAARQRTRRVPRYAGDRPHVVQRRGGDVGRVEAG